MVEVPSITVLVAIIFIDTSNITGTFEACCIKMVGLLNSLFKTYIFRGIGEVLMPFDHESGLKLLVSFFSQKLKDNDCRYSTFEKKGLAIVLAVIRFQLYQYGLISEF